MMCFLIDNISSYMDTLHAKSHWYSPAAVDEGCIIGSESVTVAVEVWSVSLCCLALNATRRLYRRDSVLLVNALLLISARIADIELRDAPCDRVSCSVQSAVSVHCKAHDTRIRNFMSSTYSLCGRTNLFFPSIIPTSSSAIAERPRCRVGLFCRHNTNTSDLMYACH